MTTDTPPPAAPPCAFRAAWHPPAFYRYRIADPGLRIRRNRYSGRDGAATIGVAAVVGAYAYCVKWADARVALAGRGAADPRNERRRLHPLSRHRNRATSGPAQNLRVLHRRHRCVSLRWACCAATVSARQASCEAIQPSDLPILTT